MEAANAPPAITQIEDEEVRVAIAWNGGVSLAVWMGGVAVELDCARRAPFGEEDAGTDAARRVYTVLSKAFRRSLVPDILTGASAGGLNGALLGAAMRAGTRLPADVLREKWLQFGDFSKLLHPTEERAPQSLMKGDLFLDEVKLMFGAILGDEDPPNAPTADSSSYAKDRDACAAPPEQLAAGLEPFPVALDVMITNVLGEPKQFLDAWENEFVSREYRLPATFREDEDFTTVPLATAARASSSFPAAFEPVKITGDIAVRTGLGPGDVRWAVDGGLLENAPVKYAIDLIPTTRTEKAVRRFLCYLDAAPTRKAEVAADPKQPTLQEVVGYVVNLPRDARVVDQLYAVEEAVTEATFAGDVQSGLLGLGDADGLVVVATALFPAYRRRRALLALQELLRSPAAGRRVFNRFDGDVRLPWLPQAFEVPNLHEGRWQWGFRAAQRLLLLEIDILRSKLDEADDPTPIRAAWTAVDAQLAALDDLRTAFLQSHLIYSEAQKVAKTAAASSDFAALPDPYQPALAAAVLHATESFLAAAGLGANGLDEFVERGLAIEVVRRAIAADVDFDTAEPINFVQLTPVCPAPIFTQRPLHENGPDSPEKKLTGIRLGHFAGFYRASWRANDYMWGRLDAAVRIVDLLLDDASTRATEVGIPAVAATLAAVLVPLDEGAAADDRRWLAHEALADALAPEPTTGIPPSVAAALTGYPADGDTPAPAALRAAMQSALVADLTDSERGHFTRIVCARAAQLEIVSQELEHLVRETQNDATLGDFTAPLDLPLRKNGSIEPAVTSMRPFWQKPDSYLPLKLGRDSPDESVSNLALQTITHTMFVALSMARGANVMLGRLLSGLRIPLLSISGVASRSKWSRAAVLATFVSGSTYLASRIVQTPKNAPASFDALWSGWVLLSWVAALGIVAVVLVPVVRAVRSGSRVRQAEQSGWAFGLSLPLLAAIGFALGLGNLGAIQLIATPHGGTHGTDAPSWLVWLVLGLIVGGAPALRTVKIPLLGAVQNPVLARVGKLPLSILLGAASLALLYWSVDALVDALDGSTWQIATAALAFASLPLCLAYLLLGTQRVRGRRLRDLR